MQLQLDCNILKIYDALLRKIYESKIYELLADMF